MPIILPKPQQKVIRDSNLDFWIDPDLATRLLPNAVYSFLISVSQVSWKAASGCIKKAALFCNVSKNWLEWHKVKNYKDTLNSHNMSSQLAEVIVMTETDEISDIDEMMIEWTPQW